MANLEITLFVLDFTSLIFLWIIYMTHLFVTTGVKYLLNRIWLVVFYFIYFSNSIYSYVLPTERSKYIKIIKFGQYRSIIQISNDSCQFSISQKCFQWSPRNVWTPLKFIWTETYVLDIIRKRMVLESTKHEHRIQFQYRIV